MSYSEILEVWLKEKQVKEGLELRNSHGFAPPIYEPLWKKYVDPRGSFYGDDDALDQAFNAKKMTLTEAAVFLMMCPGTYILREDWARAVADIRSFFESHPYKPEYVNHWPDIIEYLEREAPKSDCDAIGFYGSSVNGDDPWFREPWDETQFENVYANLPEPEKKDTKLSHTEIVSILNKQIKHMNAVIYDGDVRNRMCIEIARQCPELSVQEVIEESVRRFPYRKREE